MQRPGDLRIQWSAFQRTFNEQAGGYPVLWIISPSARVTFSLFLPSPSSLWLSMSLYRREAANPPKSKLKLDFPQGCKALGVPGLCEFGQAEDENRGIGHNRLSRGATQDSCSLTGRTVSCISCKFPGPTSKYHVEVVLPSESKSGLQISRYPSINSTSI